jgi:DNA-binding beta-propeller fold protein YncE
VWAVVIEGDVTGTVVQIDPSTGDVVEPPIPVGEGPRGLAFGLRGLWVTNYADGSVSAYAP